MSIRWTRIGPVFLEWSEDPASGARVIGWGGNDLYHCESCLDWASDYEEAVLHAAAVHQYYVSP